MKVLGVVALLLAPSAAWAQPALPELSSLPELTGPQSDYVEHCSGCHGMQGDSAPAEIPVLRDRVGYFMCTREGREYLIRLPNVAYSAITDNQELANMMNFVVFGLGGNSAPKGAKPYTAQEVARLRSQALATQSLIAARTEVVGKMVGICKVPKSMNYFYDGQEQAAR
ncbi:MAG TPA: hypothetical protein VN175_14515 [Rhizomicrobium sp.]|nr:hypothetical protein [Rhizomicrobium sp.]